MGGELGRDVMKPGRSLIRILLSGWPPRKSCAGKRGYLSTTADTKLLLATGLPDLPLSHQAISFYMLE